VRPRHHFANDVHGIGAREEAAGSSVACDGHPPPGRDRAESEGVMSGYLKQKLFQALHDLVGAGDLDRRLIHAGNYLAHVQDHEIPEEHREELGEIKAIMFATPLSPERGYSPRQISTEDGTKLAHRILELYTKVMGGLQASHPPPIAGAQSE
jgi:hypothetical protein